MNYELTDLAGKKIEREGVLFSVDPAEPHFSGVFSLITDPAKLSAIPVYYEGEGVDGIVDSKYLEMIGKKVKITYSSELEEVVDSYELFTDETVTQKEGLKPYIGLFDCDEPAEFGEEETFIYLNTDTGKETFLQKNLTEKEVGLRGKKVIVYTKQVADRWLLDIQTL
ncbi:MAG: hypothetical protein GY810_09895 [Aureispira sp.]|nr:hypothetical protein [Aureispira sp.]